ncbi:MAG: hypothetical protein CM15mP62_22330 [Rhodospirillaceae bacterium]|nr:MAG: hypothetical protein CM15mP62_22330 [Rhodospirillaceae bacterium]
MHRLPRKTPLSATPEMWEHLIEGETRDGFGFVLKGNVNDLGYQAITTPGSLKAYGEAVSQYGTWDWADIVAPAITQADEGFRVHLTSIFGGQTVLIMGESGRKTSELFCHRSKILFQ